MTLVEPTHLTARPIPLSFGFCPTVIASGTPITVFRADAHLAWFTYVGIDVSHAVANVDALGDIL